MFYRLSARSMTIELFKNQFVKQTNKIGINTLYALSSESRGILDTMI